MTPIFEWTISLHIFQAHVTRFAVNVTLACPITIYILTATCSFLLSLFVSYFHHFVMCRNVSIEEARYSIFSLSKQFIWSFWLNLMAVFYSCCHFLISKHPTSPHSKHKALCSILTLVGYQPGFHQVHRIFFYSWQHLLSVESILKCKSIIMFWFLSQWDEQSGVG